MDLTFKHFRQPLLGFIIAGTLSLSLFSCKSRHRESSMMDMFESTKFDEDDFAEALSSHMSASQPDDSAWAKKKIHGVAEVVHYTYAHSEYLPLWINENGTSGLAEKLVEELEGLQKDGINPERYKLTAIKQQLEKIRKDNTADLNAIIAADTACTYAYVNAAHDLLFGLMKPLKDEQWYHGNDSMWQPEKQLVADLSDLGKYPELKQYRSTVPTYAALMKTRERYSEMAKDNELKSAKAAILDKNVPDSLVRLIAAKETGNRSGTTDTIAKGGSPAVAQYQQFYGIDPTGKIDSNTLGALKRQPEDVIGLIDANMERIRWMGKDMEKDYIVVNVPLMELFLRRDGKDVMHMNVVVGKFARQTPSLNSDMEHVVINPPWGVPPTILKNDVLPGLERGGSAYLARKDLKVYDHKGKQVDPSVVNASNYKSFVFRQPPGDDNALGYVKFNMPNRWNIYLHDTPHREDFDKPGRAKSSGCVRVQQPQEMALYILNEMEGRRYDQGRLDSVISTQKTRFEKLKNPIPVHIVYLTAFEGGNDGQVRFLRDIYKRDAELIAALKKS